MTIEVASKLATSHSHWGGAVRRMTVETIADVDIQIVSARWRWLHSTWQGNADEVVRAKAAIDVLLDRRSELMRAAAAATHAPAAA